MSIAAIRQALEVRLTTLVVAPVEIAYENVNYPPKALIPYISVATLFAEPDDAGFRDGPFIQRGYMQATLHYPSNTGPGRAQAMAEAVRGHFYRGLSLEANDVTTVVGRTPEVTGGAIEDGRYVIRVRIRFYAQIEQLELNPVPEDRGGSWVIESW